MNGKQFEDEFMYNALMNGVLRMLHEGLITEKEYRQIDTILTEKYQPIFGSLCA